MRAEVCDLRNNLNQRMIVVAFGFSAWDNLVFVSI